VQVSIPHDTEVLKVRQNPHNRNLIASVTTTGAIDLYKTKEGVKCGTLHGLSEETFALSWNKRNSSLIASAAGS